MTENSNIITLCDSGHHLKNIQFYFYAGKVTELEVQNFFFPCLIIKHELKSGLRGPLGNPPPLDPKTGH